MKDKEKSLETKLINAEIIPVIGIIPYLKNFKNHNTVVESMGYLLYQSIPTTISTFIISGFYKASEVDQYLQVLFPKF